jgi:hypothetical protein
MPIARARWAGAVARWEDEDVGMRASAGGRGGVLRTHRLRPGGVACASPRQGRDARACVLTPACHPLAHQHVGGTVTVVGRVKGSPQGQEVHLEGPCGGDICIDRSSVQRDYMSDVVEVVGTVNADRTVTEMRSTDFNSDMDLKLYNEMVLLANGGASSIF